MCLIHGESQRCVCRYSCTHTDKCTVVYFVLSRIHHQITTRKRLFAPQGSSGILIYFRADIVQEPMFVDSVVACTVLLKQNVFESKTEPKPRDKATGWERKIMRGTATFCLVGICNSLGPGEACCTFQRRFLTLKMEVCSQVSRLRKKQHQRRSQQTQYRHDSHAKATWIDYGLGIVTRLQRKWQKDDAHTHTQP